MRLLLLILVFLLGCATPYNPMLEQLNDQVNYELAAQDNCLFTAVEKAKRLRSLGYRANAIFIPQPGKEFRHVICIAEVDGIKWVLDNGYLVEGVWPWEDVKGFVDPEIAEKE